MQGQPSVPPHHRLVAFADDLARFGAGLGGRQAGVDAGRDGFGFYPSIASCNFSNSPSGHSASGSLAMASISLFERSSNVPLAT